MAGQRRCLVADALHEASVAGDDEREVVLRVGAEAGTEVLLGDRHADGVGETLPERSGRDFDTGGVSGFRMARCGGLPLSELAQVVEFEAVARQEQQRVLQDRGVAIGEHEPVAVRPGRICRVVLHDTAVEHVAERSERHGGALVTAVGSERAVHRHPPDERDGELVLFLGQGLLGRRHAADSTRRPPNRNQPVAEPDPIVRRAGAG